MDLPLDHDETPPEHPLPLKRRTIHRFGRDIVDVLDEHHVAANLVQILQEGAVPPGSEDEPTLYVAQRRIVEGRCHRVRTQPLYRQSDIESHTQSAAEGLSGCRDRTLEINEVLGRHRQVHTAHTRCVAEIGPSLDELRLERRPAPGAGHVKGQQSLWPSSVAESGVANQIVDEGSILPSRRKGVRVEARVGHDRGQLREKRKAFEVLTEVQCTLRPGVAPARR